jgi:transcriptional regulator with XRE-family HTH domain
VPSRASPEKGFVERVARRIAEARRARGITQEDLAGRIETAPRSYQRIEAGQQNLTLRTIARIAAALDVAPEELIAGTAPLPSKPATKPRTRRAPR